jgi:ribosomal RNA assembly protein
MDPASDSVPQVVNKNKRYRKEKPERDPAIDPWKIPKFDKKDNPHTLMEESSFAVLFP